jgi:hypothetical protein
MELRFQLEYAKRKAAMLSLYRFHFFKSFKKFCKSRVVSTLIARPIAK